MTINPAEFSPIITSIFKTVYNANQIINCFEKIGLLVESDKTNKKYIGNFIFNIISEQEDILFDLIGLPENISEDDKDHIHELIDDILSCVKENDFADDKIIEAKYKYLIKRIENNEFTGETTCR